jgi:hypothetical protein
LRQELRLRGEGPYQLAFPHLLQSVDAFPVNGTLLHFSAYKVRHSFNCQFIINLTGYCLD